MGHMLMPHRPNCFAISTFNADRAGIAFGIGPRLIVISKFNMVEHPLTKEDVVFPIELRMENSRFCVGHARSPII
jgi:hypothetical protein